MENWSNGTVPGGSTGMDSTSEILITTSSFLSILGVAVVGLSWACFKGIHSYHYNDNNKLCVYHGFML